MLASATRISSKPKRSSKAAIQPRKTPSQRRSTETVEAILEASTQILEKAGLSHFNTNAIALRAGVSIGTLYQFFPNKDAIIATLIRRYEDAMFATFEQAFAAMRGWPLARSLQKLVRVMVAIHRERPALYRILEAAEDRLMEGTASHSLDEQMKGLVITMLREHGDEIGIKNIQDAATDLLLIVRALVNGALARGETRWPRLEQRVNRAVRGYLRN